VSEARLGRGVIESLVWTDPDLIAPIRPLQLYADGGYQLRIRRLEGTPNYGPRQGVTSGIRADPRGFTGMCELGVRVYGAWRMWA
jgi:hypothetical protein